MASMRLRRGSRTRPTVIIPVHSRRSSAFRSKEFAGALHLTEAASRTLPRLYGWTASTVADVAPSLVSRLPHQQLSALLGWLRRADSCWCGSRLTRLGATSATVLAVQPYKRGSVREAASVRCSAPANSFDRNALDRLE